MIGDDIDVLVVGAGPAGLSAARVLGERGVGRVLVVDREAAPGGIPRFCPHPTFGLTDFFRPMSGPAYAQRLAARVAPDTLQLGTTVTAIAPDGCVTLSGNDGERRIAPRRVLLATGIRETPRSARLVSGDRPLNVMTTGALQRMVAVSHSLPFERPVIVGTELVSFSAVLTLRDCGVRVVAMIEESDRIRTLRPADTLTEIGAALCSRAPARLHQRNGQRLAAPVGHRGGLLRRDHRHRLRRGDLHRPLRARGVAARGAPPRPDGCRQPRPGRRPVLAARRAAALCGGQYPEERRDRGLVRPRRCRGRRRHRRRPARQERGSRAPHSRRRARSGEARHAVGHCRARPHARPAAFHGAHGAFGDGSPDAFGGRPHGVALAALHRASRAAPPRLARPARSHWLETIAVGFDEGRG